MYAIRHEMTKSTRQSICPGMTDEPKSKRDRRNAFERARDSVLAIDAGWWQALAASGLAEVEFDGIEHVQLGDERCVVGGIVFERRMVTLRREGERQATTNILTRPVMTRFSALPLGLLERLAHDILEQSEAEWRDANLQAVIDAARGFDLDEAIETARDILGDDATDDKVRDLAEQMRFPDELVEGGEAAAKFFDDNISVVSIEEDGEGGAELAPEPPPAPGRNALILDEWDIYSPEEVAGFDGPESDAAYAFRVVRLCEAIREMPNAAVQLAVQLGAVTREWEMWRENGEFIAAGRARFAQQSELAKSRLTRPWMVAVRDDLECGRIGDNVAQYARQFRLRRRDLKPPSEDRIRNYLSELRRSPKSS